MTRVAITGAAGRMGRTLVQALEEVDALTLGAAFERPGQALIGADAPRLEYPQLEPAVRHLIG